MKYEELEILNLAVDTLDKITKLDIDEDIRETLIEEVLKALEIKQPRKRKPRGELQQRIVETLEDLGPATAKQIADTTGLDKNAISSTLTRLEAKGVVQRQPVEDDGKNGRGRQVEFVFALSDCCEEA